MDRYFGTGFTARNAASAPHIAWNRDDALQEMFLRRVFKRPIAPPTHYVPTAEGFAAAVRAGLGWGCSPAAGRSRSGIGPHLQRTSRRPAVLAVLEARQFPGREADGCRVLSGERRPAGLIRTGPLVRAVINVANPGGSVLVR